MSGAWKLAPMEPCNLPEKVATGFSKVFENWVGASYTPVLYCGEQLVHGTNYMIICKQTLITATPAEHLVNVIIHEPLPSDPDKEWKLLMIDTIC